MTNIFDILILNGRPASGKSEIIDFLEHLDPQERLERFHIGKLAVLDDFPMLWTWFEEDHILETILGKPRLHTSPDGNFKHDYLWDLLIERLGLEYHKLLLEQKDGAPPTTAIVEFSRGVEHGGYQRAYYHLPVDLLQRAVILYVNVSFQESLRKNRRRFNPNKPHSILEHGLSDQKLELLYGEDDFDLLTASGPDFLEIKGVRVPYAVFENEDDVTTGKPEQLEQRLEECLLEIQRKAISERRKG
jgi:hypothetical protein